MVLPRWLAKANRVVTNPLMRRLVGVGWVVEVEHVGRSTGRTFRTVLLAFPRGDVVTVALTYGSDVDWLKNLRAASGGRLRLGRELLTVGAPRALTTADGLSRMPWLVRQVLPLAGVDEFIDVPVLSRQARR